MNKTRLSEKRYSDSLKKDEQEIRLINKKYKKRNKNIRKSKEDYKK